MSDASLAARAGVPTNVVAAIRTVESGGNVRAVRFETRLFHERTGRTIEGHSRATFSQAFAVNQHAAVESTSWGRYQVLGSALLRLYGSPSAAVAAFDRDPAGVSDALLAEWFRSRPAAQAAANEGDWMELARLYNGSNQTPWYGRFIAALEQPASEMPITLGLAIGGGFLVFGAGLLWATTRLGTRGA